ncbi:hypothetical protein J2X31_003635 [Flavobacterium arsenatis]|uniref:MFS transporter n=1 Tax=Flavobacterium arsenatis TaxID=1484332 RepID=A0ABU1TUX2_9FLAO|nr:hypothetical protein [Flavobacterium arsenatis]MDR6969602.1 hypothetical protein [Flavobacterium arsenatis]
MTTQENKVKIIFEKFKSIAIGLIGAGIIGKGITYFSPQLSYDIPRILVPVYKAFGAMGLAVSMVLLGIALLIWSFYRWGKGNGKPLHWVLMAGIGAIAIVVLIYLVEGKKPAKSSLETHIESQSNPQPVVANANDVVDFPAIFPVEKKQEFDVLVKNLEDALLAKKSGPCWTAYNKLNIFVSRLNLDPNNTEQLNFLLQQKQKMDHYNQQIKDLDNK